MMSVDCTFTASDTSDYVAMAVIGETAGRYLLDMVNERLDVVATMAKMQAKARQWGPAAILVEAAANGHTVMQMMKGKVPNMIGIKPAQGGSKTTRVQAAAPIIEAGNFYSPSVRRGSSRLWLNAPCSPLARTMTKWMPCRRH